MDSFKFAVVDAFTDKPFKGNSAAVVVLTKEQEENCSDSFRQEFAKEMALSETAYTYEIQPNEKYSLRWFTPTVEVVLCGHATLATAHHLFSIGVKGDANGAITFSTKSGDLMAKKVDNGIELDFPAEIVHEKPIPDGFLEALGIVSDQVEFHGENRMDIMVVIKGGLSALSAISPDQIALGKFQTRCVLVTTIPSTEEKEHHGFDFVSRVFAPCSGIAEDPVTGSAHCAIAPYWSSRLNKTSLHGYQASARGGHVYCTIAGDRVRLCGKAVTVTRGELDAVVRQSFGI